MILPVVEGLYDEVGLLTPAKINSSTGYRFLRLQQLARLYRLLALKGLGLPSKKSANSLKKLDDGTNAWDAESA